MGLCRRGGHLPLGCHDGRRRAGSQGATLRANIVGGAGRTGRGIDASITFTSLSVQQARGFQIATGMQAGNSYLHIYNPGV